MTERSLLVTSKEAVLEVKGLRVNFHTYAGEVKALNGVELTVKKGEILGLVGESGCGKSVTALAIAGLLPQNAEVVSGEILLEGRDLLRLTKEEIRLTRLGEIAIVFQDPATYLNPVITIGAQITEILTSDRKHFQHELVSAGLKDFEDRTQRIPLSPALEKEGRRLRSIEPSYSLRRGEVKRLAKLLALSYLRMVKLPDAARVFKMYPFELSGGMRQRAIIAMALARRPKLLLADEITTALDVTVQAQILRLLKELKEQVDTSVILITHDLAVVAELCDRAAVMYAGNIVEVAEVTELFANPLHPYTKGLLESIPRPDSRAELKSIAGSVPDLIFPPTGCRFHPRCPFAFDRCPKVDPPLVEVSPGHKVACLLYGG
jgi:oligopeptide/dipeptide ABC transporter ATP-binding protein